MDQQMYVCDSCGSGYLGVDSCPRCHPGDGSDGTEIHVPWVRTNSGWAQQRIDGSIWLLSDNGPVPDAGTLSGSETRVCDVKAHVFVGTDDASCPICEPDGLRESVVSSGPEARKRRMGFDPAAILLSVLVIVVIIIAIASFSGSESAVGEPATTITESSSPAVTGAPAGDATSTTQADSPPPPTVASPDASIGEFLTLVAGLEANEQFEQAADGEIWYLGVEEYRVLADDYLQLAERWDRVYSGQADRLEPGLGELMSHGLIRRSDGYRLVTKASTPEAIDLDIDGMYWTLGVDALTEATNLVNQAWMALPLQLNPGVVPAQEFLDDSMIDGVNRPDMISISRQIVGDCYELPPDDEVSYSVNRSECTRGAVRVFWSEDLANDFDDFPGEDQVLDEADRICSERADARFPFEAEEMLIWWWYPNAETWESGDARVTCVFEI